MYVLSCIERLSLVNQLGHKLIHQAVARCLCKVVSAFICTHCVTLPFEGLLCWRRRYCACMRRHSFQTPAVRIADVPAVRSIRDTRMRLEYGRMQSDA